MNELQTAMQWLALGERIFAAGAGPWNQIKGVLAANGIEADTAALDAVIENAERRKALAKAEAEGQGFTPAE